jgi:Ras-related protein Rab-8A
VRNWVRNIDGNTPQTVNKILIGNKCDITGQRQVTTAQGEQLAREYGMKFLETSARANTNVTDAFLTIATDVVERLLANGGGEPQPVAGGITITADRAPSNRSGCNC